MGYLTYVEGEITISPEIPWGEVKNSPFLPGENGWPDRDLALRIQEEVIETHEGTLTRRSAVAVAGANLLTEDRYKAYEIEAHLQELLDCLGNGRTFNGYLEGSGEDSGDMWRLYVRDGKATKVKVQLVSRASQTG